MTLSANPATRFSFKAGIARLPGFAAAWIIRPSGLLPWLPSLFIPSLDASHRLSVSPFDSFHTVNHQFCVNKVDQ
jgi:hypothetical protein